MTVTLPVLLLLIALAALLFGYSRAGVLILLIALVLFFVGRY